MEPSLAPLDPNTAFTFDCNPDVPCFNECCRDLNQFLTPYDVLRLTRRMKTTSTVFLTTYTEVHQGPETGLPVVCLNMADTPHRLCPFVTRAGCSVYEDRPASCRTYPLARAIRRCRQTGAITEHFAVLQEPHCRGFEKGTARTPKDWMADQDLSEYNRQNDALLELISLKARLRPGPLGPEDGARFYMACYDLTTFRTRITNHTLERPFPITDSEIQEALSSDEALLTFGLSWIRRYLFGDAR
ncbi:MAG: zinc/iron-chelating domain-containing protein [Deltaproteobacteria bacterium]|nr:MAG: zinc/iron-chelating domain-containing protein [Deltaproteobacteria bacterium]